MRRRHLVGAAAAATMAMTILPFSVNPAGAVSEPEIVATGLNAPYKLTFGPDGALYVAESGTAGDEECLERTSPESGEVMETCYGATGSVTRIDLEAGEQERTVTGLPSIGGGGEVAGPADVAFSPVVGDAGGVMHVISGLGGDDEYRDHFTDPRIGTIFTVDDEGETEVLSDLVAFEAENDPDQAYNEGLPEGVPPISEGVDSNPFGLTFDGAGDDAGDILAVDAGGNAVLRVQSDGTTTVEKLLPFGMAELPAFTGAPPGTMAPYQPVPTAIDVDADGVPLVGQLTGFPFPVGGADVYEIDGSEGEPTVREDGFTNIMDIDVAPDGSLYVLEYADNGMLSEEPAAALVQVRPDGTRKHLVYGGDLESPGGVEVGPDGMVYVTVCSQCGPGEGEVWKFDPNVASDPATADACPPADVLGTDLSDIAPSVHRAAIECMVWWGAVEGNADGTFGPGTPVRRDQVASMVVRSLAAAGAQMPTEAPEDAFTDDEDNVHEDAINVLASMGIIEGYPDGTFRGSMEVTRAQTASIFIRAWYAVTEFELEGGEDAFTDDEESVHEDAINNVAAMGWMNGVGEGRFAPQASATRGQFASTLARLLSTLVDQGEAERPAVG